MVLFMCILRVAEFFFFSSCKITFKGLAFGCFNLEIIISTNLRPLNFCASGRGPVGPALATAMIISLGQLFVVVPLIVASIYHPLNMLQEYDFEPVDNCINSVLGQDVELTDEFKVNFERWLHKEVYNAEIKWELLLDCTASNSL